MFGIKLTNVVQYDTPYLSYHQSAKWLVTAVVTPLRKVATYRPRIKEKLHELGKSKRITGH